MLNYQRVKAAMIFFFALYIKALAEHINSMNVASCRHHVSNISGPGVNIKAIEIVSTLWL